MQGSAKQVLYFLTLSDKEGAAMAQITELHNKGNLMGKFIIAVANLPHNLRKSRLFFNLNSDTQR